MQGVHGDISEVVSYPIALVEIHVGEKVYQVEAAVSEKLPVSVVLGRDIPDLVELLCDDFRSIGPGGDAC